MSVSLIIRDRNPDNDFVLHGETPPFTERKSFYMTNSDITNTTKNLSQHGHRAKMYWDAFKDDENLRHSLRSMSRSLRLLSGTIRKSLEEESTAKRFIYTKNENNMKIEANGNRLASSTEGQQENRPWLSDSEWNTDSGHHVAYSKNIPSPTLLNKNPSLVLSGIFSMSPNKLQKQFNVDMDLAEVPLTRFTRKDLMASKYFPITMSCSSTSLPPRRSRSQTRHPDRLTKSAQLRVKTPDRFQVRDNFHSMKRLEKLYLTATEAPSLARAPHTIMSPYHEEISRLRLERLHLEEEHYKELSRLSTLERVRGPKSKWYELKDTQFHFEAGKNNELLRTQNQWNATMKSHFQNLSQSQLGLTNLCTQAASSS